MAYELWRNHFGPWKNDFAHIFDKYILLSHIYTSQGDIIPKVKGTSVWFLFTTS